MQENVGKDCEGEPVSVSSRSKEGAQGRLIVFWWIPLETLSVAQCQLNCSEAPTYHATECPHVSKNAVRVLGRFTGLIMTDH